MKQSMTSFPVITTELAARIEASILFFSTQKQKALQSLPGNPYGVHIRSFGNITALLAEKTHNSEFFNIVGNIQGDDLQYIDALIDWYRSYGVRCSFDIVPPHASTVLLWHLASKGFYQSSFYSVLYGLPQIATPPLTGIIVRPVTPEEREIFADVYFDSFEVPNTETYAYLRDSIRVLVDIPTNHCFFALIDNTIAAIAVLSIHQKTGYFALAATRPAFRGRGCQMTLGYSCMAKAMEVGCNLITGQAGVTTTSHQNAEKFGFRIAYTKAIWSPFDPQKRPNTEADPANR